MINNPWVIWELLFSIIAWWAQVTDTPELIKIIVFNKGIWKGLNGIILVGGQIAPISILGARLLWKKSSKKRYKKENFWYNK